LWGLLRLRLLLPMLVVLLELGRMGGGTVTSVVRCGRDRIIVLYVHAAPRIAHARRRKPRIVGLLLLLLQVWSYRAAIRCGARGRGGACRRRGAIGGGSGRGAIGIRMRSRSAETPQPLPVVANLGGRGGLALLLASSRDASSSAMRRHQMGTAAVLHPRLVLIFFVFSWPSIFTASLMQVSPPRPQRTAQRGN
jgi:hypothetical protein